MPVSHKTITKTLTLVTALAVGVVCLKFSVSPNQPSLLDTDTSDLLLAQEARSYLIKADDVNALKAVLKELNITPSHELKIIKTLAAPLTDEQKSQIEQRLKVKITDNHQVELTSIAKATRRQRSDAVVPYQTDSDLLHFFFNNFGQSVTIGYLDTGLDQLPGLSKDMSGFDKAWGTYDAVGDVAYNYDKESNGHGTHIASVANNSDVDTDGYLYGVAPNAANVSIKAFDDEGKSTYADVIRGIEWALTYKDAINLRILNMSFSGPVVSYYWDDPLNQAVMTAWKEGIVVVASAGNKGPEPMTIGVPGNVPYIITVGAITDSYTPYQKADDKVAGFSSAGPTLEGFVKPELVAPGGHMIGLMSMDSQLASEHPEFHDGGLYFEMSGTSQATAVVSGVVAQLLTDDPTLTPDQVKCRLLSSAHMAVNDDGSLAYSPFQQGAGMVNALDALYSSENDCANIGLDIDADLAGDEHFFGPANVDENGNFYVTDMPGSTWYLDQGTAEGAAWRSDVNVDGGLLWRTTFDTTGGLLWRTAALSTDGGLLWRTNFEIDGGLLWRTTIDVDGGLLWRTSVVYDGTQHIAINNWVEQE